MGGCASRPKDMAVKDKTVPEAPVSPKQVNNVSQEGNDEGVETQQAGDAPAVDSSEPKKDDEAEAETAAVSAEAEKPKEEMAVATESKSEETKVEESKAEEPKVEVEESKSEETKVEAVVKTED